MKPTIRNGLSICLLLVVFGMIAQAQVMWQKSSANPVIHEYLRLDDPTNLKYGFEPGVIYDSTLGVFRMWFTQLTYDYGSFFRIASAVSFDGEEWFISARSPVYSGGGPVTFDPTVRHPRVIRNKTGYLMYYTGDQGTAPPQNAIGLATSSDGKSWFRYGYQPILRLGLPGSWDPACQGFCDVHYDGDSTYSMWFWGWDGVHNGIGLATSSDGVSWVENPGNPLFVPSPASWDSLGVTEPCVVFAHGVHYLFYLGSPAPYVQSVGLATSEDGIHWTRYGKGPILSAGVTWDGVYLSGLTVLFKNETFHMWYSGLSATTGHWQTGYATSPYTSLGVTGGDRLPVTYVLQQGYPNPFNPETEIRYSLPQKSHVTLRIIDEVGREVTTLVNEEQGAGEKSIQWNARGYASGVYFYRLQAGDFVATKKLVLLK
jgi:predicted GH43/DUF377 family glycosyl hydrolase